MSIPELKTKIAALSPDDRRELAAFLVSLRHRDWVRHGEQMARKIDDKNPDHWLTWEELDQRLEL